MAEPAAPFILDAATAEKLTGGRWIGSRGELVLHGLAIDSRQVVPGCIFACFTGQHVDGHDYVDTAVGDGAALIL
ncbi:MAG: Mur ligase domain-containing protein, partial [Planctomycetota bacterium]